MKKFLKDIADRWRYSGQRAEAYLEFLRVTNPTHQGLMLAALSDMAKIGWTSVEMKEVIKAAERSRVIVFSGGQPLPFEATTPTPKHYVGHKA